MGGEGRRHDVKGLVQERVGDRQRRQDELIEMAEKVAHSNHADDADIAAAIQASMLTSCGGGSS